MTNPNPPPPDASMERAVEAALPIIRESRCGTQGPWCGPELNCYCRVIATASIAAADRARCRSWIDWRPHAEWVPLTVGEPYRDILVESELAQGSVSVTRMKTAQSLPTWFRRWAEMPAADAWGEKTSAKDADFLSPPRGQTAGVQADGVAPDAPSVVSAEPHHAQGILADAPNTLARTATGQCAYFHEPCRSVSSCMRTGKCIRQAEAEQVARTATDGEDSNHPGTTCETPGAAVLAGGASDGDGAWKQDYLPWNCPELRDWAIVGMNHYMQDGARHLFVAMTKDGVCIKSEDVDERYVWFYLRQKASAHNFLADAPDTIARTATDGEDSNHPGTTHETPGAAVLAGGEKRTLPEIMRERHGNRPYRADYDDEPTVGDEPTRLSDLELRVIALEQNSGHMNEELMRQGTCVAALALVRKIPRPWIDGGVTHAEWEGAWVKIDAARDAAQAALTKET
jgi:hypothetical protein